MYKLESCGLNEIFKPFIGGSGYPICTERNGKLVFCYGKACAIFDPSVTPISDAYTSIARVVHVGIFDYQTRDIILIKGVCDFDLIKA